MLFLRDNLKKLRQEQSLSQQALSEKLLISRASLAKYESGINEPSLDVVVRMSRYFNITVDALLTINLDAYKEGWQNLSSLDKGMIMPIQVNAQGENVVEIVPHSAQAGYLGNYSDPGFIETLDQMALPFQELHGKCRAFPIEGDSMPPYGDGSFVIGRLILDRNDIQNDKRYVLLSRDDGIVFKRVRRDVNRKDLLNLHSDNPKYPPYEIRAHEIVEVWEFVGALSFDHARNNFFENEVLSRVNELKGEIEKLANDLTQSR